MNKKILVALASTLAIGAVAVPGAMAQGYMTQSASNWTGPYVGARVGINNAEIDPADSEAAFTGGVQAGYDMNLGGPVVGVEGSADFNSKTDYGLGEIGSNIWGLSGKLGVDMGQVMPYGKLGWAYTNLTGDADEGEGGLTGGLGLEYKMMPNVSVKGEWTYNNAEFFGGTDVTNNAFTVGVNYRMQ